MQSPTNATTATMKALRLEHWQSPAVLRDVDRPEPGPGEVLVQVGGAGACHSDLHLMHEFGEGQLPWSPPFTLGHENAGWVHTLGDGVTGLEPGQPVAVVGAWGCGTCERCRADLETYCDHPERTRAPGGGGGLGLDGGMAEFLLVPDARHLVPLPDGLEPVHAAPLTDAALTPYHAVRRSWGKLGPGATAVVIGVGGLGHLGIQVLHATTAARIIAVDPRESARDLAKRSGADLVLAPGDALAATVREATGGIGADVVLDFVGSDETLLSAAAMVRQLGDLTLVGLGGGTLPVSFFSPPYEVSVQSTYWGNRHELVEVLDLASRGLLHAEVRVFGLEEVVTAYELLAAGAIDGRAVIAPNTEYRP
jgi:propanol-preferring alcohol dehydrogenase